MMRAGQGSTRTLEIDGRTDGQTVVQQQLGGCEGDSSALQTRYCGAIGATEEMEMEEAVVAAL